MSILVYPEGPDAVKAYRFYKAGFDTVEVPEPPSHQLVRWLSKNGTDWDAFWTNAYQHDTLAFTSLLQEKGVPLIAEVDDFFEEVPTGNQAFVSWRHHKKNLYKSLLGKADRVVCSTPWLANRYGGQVAPNFVSEEEWDWPRRPDNSKITLLHCGSVNRAEDYLAIEDAFRAFLDEPDTQIIFMGWMPSWANDYENGKVAFCRWVEFEKYNRMMRWLAPDILVSPMRHNNFNLAKSNIKWLEAGMTGACFVGERWGEYARTVEENADGLLADTQDEWTDRLVWVARNPEKAAQIAEAGRKSVLEKWTWKSVGSMWREAILGEDHGVGAQRIAGGAEQHTAAANG